MFPNKDVKTFPGPVLPPVCQVFFSGLFSGHGPLSLCHEQTKTLCVLVCHEQTKKKLWFLSVFLAWDPARCP